MKSWTTEGLQLVVIKLRHRSQRLLERDYGDRFIFSTCEPGRGPLQAKMTFSGADAH
jgi:hypothetical protein